jgi:hypothetical protein
MASCCHSSTSATVWTFSLISPFPTLTSPQHRIVLEAAGYFVLSASDGADALNISRQYPGTIHALLSDVNLPNRVTGSSGPTARTSRCLHWPRRAGFRRRRSNRRVRLPDRLRPAHSSKLAALLRWLHHDLDHSRRERSGAKQFFESWAC